MINRILSAILSLAILMGTGAVNLTARADFSPVEVQDGMKWINPEYVDIIDIPEITESGGSDVLTANVSKDAYLTSKESLITEIRNAMESRTEQFTVRYMTDAVLTEEDLKDFLMLAVEETGVSTQGDYLWYNCGAYGFNYAYTLDGGTYYHDISYNIMYFTTAQQEAELTEKIDSVLSGFSFTSDTSESEKIQTIYNYICRNVVYDYDNLADDTYYLKYSAYAAMINGTAVCQGYATLLYRMLMEAGISCRIIGGTSFGENHAWNIAAIDGLYYYLDSTWDAGAAEYQYFLVCPDDFDDHEPAEKFTTESFLKAYPMADTSYQFSSEAVTDGDFIYSVSNGEATLEKYTGYAQDVVIPDNINGIPVVTIGTEAFYYNTTVISVTIPASVRYIEDGQNFGFADNRSAFGSCYSLESVYFPADSQLSYLGSDAFHGCYNLKQITLPGSLRTIANSCFVLCESLTELIIPEGVQTVGQGALEGTGLQSITIPKSCTAFHIINPTEQLEEYLVAEGNPVYRSHEGVLYQYYDSYGWVLTQYPAGKTANSYRVADYATAVTGTSFANNPYLETLYIGTCIVPEWGSLFSLSQAPCKIIPDDENAHFSTQNGMLLSGDETILEQIPDSLTGTITLPETVTEICAYAGSNGNFSEIIFPEGLQRINTAAFWMNDDLQSLKFPSSLRSIGSSTFSECFNLRSVVFSPGITSLPDNLFDACKSLEYVALPATIVSISDSCFAECDKLKDVYFSGTEEQWLQIQGIDSPELSNARIHYESTEGYPHTHSFSDYVYNEDGNCIRRGTQTAKCAYCDVTDTTYASVTRNHSYSVDYTVAPTCTEDGVERLVCTLCGDETYETLPSVAHTIVNGICTVCGDTITTSGRCGKNLVWTIAGGTLTISGSGPMYEWTDGEQVPWYSAKASIQSVVMEGGTTISSLAFQSCRSLSSVTIAASVTAVGAYAFSDCSALVELTLSDGIKSIDQSAFYNCTALEKIVLPKGLTSLGHYTFDGCSSLREIALPGSLQYVGAYLFRGCDNLESVFFGEGITEISEAMFWGNKKLKQVDFADSIEIIGADAFSQCTALTEIALPKKLVTIGRRAFFVTSLTAVTIPDSVKSIEAEAFAGCTKLASVAWGTGLERIGEQAFNLCALRGDLILPETLITVEAGAFNNCGQLSTVYIGANLASVGALAFDGVIENFQVSSENQTFSSLDGVLFDHSQTTVINFPGFKSKTVYVIPESVLTIGDYAFSNTYGLNAVVLPNALQTIGKYAFHNSAIVAIDIPYTVRTIGDYAFDELSIIKVHSSNEYYCAVDNMLYSKDQTTLLRNGGIFISDLQIPYGVEELATGSCRSSDALERVTLSGSVVKIGDYAFEGCLELREIMIPPCVREISDSAFYEIENPPAIHGVKGSYAETYANSHGITFVAHDFDQGVINEQTSCSQPRIVTYHCSDCDWTYSEQADVMGHSYGESEIITTAGYLTPGQQRLTCTECGYSCTEEVACLPVPFADAVEGAFYYTPMLWALDKNITTGTSKTTFAPDTACSRGQIITMLWRAAGQPKSTATNPFTDVPEDAYYYDAVLWAYEQGITIGTGATTFSPDMICTRGQIVTLLWRFAGNKSAKSTALCFTDVDKNAYYYEAVQWALEEGVTTGVTNTTFAPDDVCSRAEAVTFLYREDAA